MAIATGLIRVACSTSTGTQDIRDANMTTTPNAAIFIVSRSTVDGTAAAHNSIGIGATDGTNQWALATMDEDAVTTTNNGRRGATNRCVLVQQPSAFSVDGDAAFSSWLADAGSGAGVQINWQDAPASGYFLTVLLFAVDNAQAGVYTNNSSTDGTTVVTTGFEPTLIFASTIGAGVASANSRYSVSFGACQNDLTQYSICSYMQDGQSAPAVRQIQHSDRIAGWAYHGSWADWEAEITAIGATSFTSTVRLHGNTSQVGYLALDTGTIGAWVGPVSSPTSTGNDSQTGPGFEPQMVIQGVSALEARDTVYTTAVAGTLGISAFTANNEYCSSGSSEIGASTTNTQSLSDDTAVECPADDGTALCTAAFVSFNSTGWTLNHTAVSATAKLWFGIAIEAESSGGGGSISLAGALSPSGDPGRKTATSKAGALSFSGSPTLKTAVSLIGVLDPSGLVVRAIARALSGILSFNGTVTKKAKTTISGILSSSGQIGRRVATAVSGGLQPSGSQSRLISRLFSGTLTSVGNANKKTAVDLGGDISPTGTVAAIATVIIKAAVSGALSFAGGANWLAKIGTAGVLSTAGVTSRHIKKFMAGTVTVTGRTMRTIKKTLTGLVDWLGTVVGSQSGPATYGYVQISLSEPVSAAATLTEQTNTSILLTDNVTVTVEIE